MFKETNEGEKDKTPTGSGNEEVEEVSAEKEVQYSVKTFALMESKIIICLRPNEMKSVWKFALESRDLLKIKQYSVEEGVEKDLRCTFIRSPLYSKLNTRWKTNKIYWPSQRIGNR